MPVRESEASKTSPNTAKMAVVLTGKMPVLRETAFFNGLSWYQVRQPRHFE